MNACYYVQMYSWWIYKQNLRDCSQTLVRGAPMQKVMQKGDSKIFDPCKRGPEKKEKKIFQ